ncbi:hypothetical protein PIB30_035846 [Stylosanthes scabra]|uniref:Uncharacterized protein n=1 Tax=Stylosanthes scabra TaxID=79078 RepID=A0ABU6QDJ3_9FABA|nr:hypothetical protein [Stylosanthes scabra]
MDTTREWLWKAFGSTRRVEDVYLSGKARRSHSSSLSSGIRSGTSYKDIVVGGRTGGDREGVSGKNWEEEGKKATGEWGIQTLGESKIRLRGDHDIRERLKRSMVGESLNPYDFEMLTNLIKSEWEAIEEVKMMGAMKMLIIFDSCQSLDMALELEWWYQHFIEIRRWSTKEGKVLKVQEEEGGHYSSFKILVEANAGPAIRAFATVVIENEEFTIFIKEEGGTENREKCRSEERTKVLMEANGETNREAPILNEQRDEAANDESEEVGHAKNNNGPIGAANEKENSGSPTKMVTHNDDRRTNEIIKEWEEDCYQKIDNVGLDNSGDSMGPNSRVADGQDGIGLERLIEVDEEGINVENNQAGSSSLSTPPGFDRILPSQSDTAKNDSDGASGTRRKKAKQINRKTVRRTTLRLSDKIKENAPKQKEAAKKKIENYGKIREEERLGIDPTYEERAKKYLRADTKEKAKTSTSKAKKQRQKRDNVSKEVGESCPVDK